MIPKHCIKLFQSEYGVYPSYKKLYIGGELFMKLIGRSELIWCHHSIENGVDTMLSALYSHHEDGISIYLDSVNFNEHCIYIMYDISKQDIVNLIINQITKKNKNGN